MPATPAENVTGSASPALAARRVDSLRAALAAAQLGGLAEPVTFSAGVAGVGPRAASLQALLHAADQALYQAKRDGRNRTALAHGAD